MIYTSLCVSRPPKLVQLGRSHNANLTVLPRMYTGDVLKTRTLRFDKPSEYYTFYERYEKEISIVIFISNAVYTPDNITEWYNSY